MAALLLLLTLAAAAPNQPDLPLPTGDEEAPVAREVKVWESSPPPAGQLTLANSSRKVFTMAKSNAFIQVDGTPVKTFQLRLCREISFQFRTRLPHGLLVYHGIKNRPDSLDPYALYIIVEKGQLKVVHVFGKHSTSLIVGEGLNRDQWHYVMVAIDVHGARLIARVDDQTHETLIQGLHPSKNYDVDAELDSVVLIGGLSAEEKLHGVKYIIESFVGCIKDVVLSAGKAASDLLPIEPLVATKHYNIDEACIDKCVTRENLCFEASLCINHYNRLSCDCFGTEHEGEQCDIYTGTVLTLRGWSYVSYRVYDWKDRVHSSTNRISFHFKTRFDNSALFYASGEEPAHHHIAVSVVNSTAAVHIDLGTGPSVAVLGTVTDGAWHNLTLIHDSTAFVCYLDGTPLVLNLPGPLHHLYIDPEIYIGGGPELHKRKGLMSQNNFVGSLKYVFFNDVSILYELNKANPKVHYIGVLVPEFLEADVMEVPMTFAFPSSHFWWPTPDPNHLRLRFDFKSARNSAVLASSHLPSTQSYWLVKQVNDEVRLEVGSEVVPSNVTLLTTVKYDPARSPWHSVEVEFGEGEVALSVDQGQVHRVEGRPALGANVIIASTHLNKGSTGLVGCMRNIEINGAMMEPRSVVGSQHMVGTVSLDDCRLVDPCKRPNACEHGGKCSVREDKTACDCHGTGYIGKNCHFAQFRKTCEELALLGYTKPDVYLIDIDGNGRFPPAHVKCEFQSVGGEDSTKTIVEHNLPSQVDVRSQAESDFSFSITYREFSSEMLEELVSHSLHCSQHIKYDCYKAPLELHSATWFLSAANNSVDYLGATKRGTCPCAVNRTCVNPTQSCNCDISEAKWLSDEGLYVEADSLGITQMVFLQQKDLGEDALGRITLGPLECIETNTQKYVVTFTTSQSYIEVPGWRKGDIAFSFRTTGKRAILLYQPPIRQHHPSFMVALTSDFQLTFNFTLNTGTSRELKIKSMRQLNSGEWQKIWIDYNEHHVRFMINTDYKMVDLRPEEEFGPFEGSMFIGGATEELLREGRVPSEGLIGCFRGLVVNGEILDIYSYMSVHLSEIIKDCKPSCDPNPCKNGATCRELWSTFECVCENPWAYIGTYCQTNINENGMTLVRRGSMFKRSFLQGAGGPERTLWAGLLTQDLLVNLRTYDTDALVLHANDHLNNFVQLYITQGSRVTFLFNSDDLVHNLTVHYPELSSGKSVQIAVERNEPETILHVNNLRSSVLAAVSLLSNYSQRPWQEGATEVVAPPRPVAPPSQYLQVMVGGYDDGLLAVAGEATLGGYVGCIRGLKIGETLVNLTQYIIAAEVEGLVPGCRMKCDTEPCKNQGVCIEDFLKGESSCDCEYTSYYGEHCNQEKGAALSGDSLLQRRFLVEGPVSQVRVQLAFSSADDRQRNTVLLLIQTENKRSYYLLVGVSAEGDLILEEDREGGAVGVKLRDRYFLNGARHSIYYRRTNDSAILLVDREEVQLAPIQVLSLTDVPDPNPGSNEVQIGGLNTTDPRFTAYTSYTGCLANVIVEVNEYKMRPLDEYMLFTKSSEDVIVKNSQGIRIAQCASFDETNKPRPGPSLNYSSSVESSQWVEDPPKRIPYRSLYSEPNTEEETTGTALFIVALGVVCTVVCGSLYHVYRSDVAYRRRKERGWTPQVQFQEAPIISIANSQASTTTSSIKATRSRSVCEASAYAPNGRVAQPADPSPLRSSLKLTRSKSVSSLATCLTRPLQQDDASLKQALADKPTAYKVSVGSTGPTPSLAVRFRVPDQQLFLPRENGGLKVKETNEDQVMMKILKPVDVEDVMSSTINEDSAGEREEETTPTPVVEEDRHTLMGSCSSIQSNISSRSRRLAPVFLSAWSRGFTSPLSYFGVRLHPRKTFPHSRESVLSLD